MRGLRQEFSTSVLLITHDLGGVNELADRVAGMYAGRIVEAGTREEILGNPSHPYTRGLLGAMPSRALQGDRLNEIPGVVPQPTEWPAGCRFCTRCPRKLEICEQVIPGRTALSETHEVYCHAVQQDVSK